MLLFVTSCFGILAEESKKSHGKKLAPSECAETICLDGMLGENVELCYRSAGSHHVALLMKHRMVNLDESKLVLLC